MAAAGLAVLVLLALAGLPRPGTPWTLPPLSNVQHTIDFRRCRLNVMWGPPESRINDTCSLWYESRVWTDGINDATEKLDNELSRTETVNLGKEIVFGVRPSCRNHEDVHGAWFNITLQQKGIPGTGAANISCIWHNKQYFTCSWKAGENATESSYNLFYGFTNKQELNQCTNSSREGNNFQCTFSYEEPQSTSLYILIEGHSKDVRPMCIWKGRKGFPVKTHPPLIVNISKDSSGVYLNWTKPISKVHLRYRIEINDTTSGSAKFENSDDQTDKTISLKPHKHHTFRVRVEPDEWRNIIASDWSKEVVWDETENTTFYTLLYIFIPFCVAVLTIILLVYLKRIKLLILPKIPDPEQVLKKMFEDQSEDVQKQPTYNPVKDEQIQSLTHMEATGNEI